MRQRKTCYIFRWTAYFGSSQKNIAVIFLKHRLKEIGKAIKNPFPPGHKTEWKGIRFLVLNAKWNLSFHTLLPHSPQNAAPGSSFAPQFMQNSGAFFAPQFSQKRLSGRKGAPQFLQKAFAVCSGFHWTAPDPYACAAKPLFTIRRLPPACTPSAYTSPEWGCPVPWPGGSSSRTYIF